MPCYYNNKKELSLVNKNDFKKEIYEKYLGYYIDKDYKIIKYLDSKKQIVDCRDTIKRYIIKSTDLSIQEIEIINNILDSYKKVNIDINNQKEINHKQVYEDLEKELINYCYFNNIELDEDQFKYILDLSYKNLYKFGPLSDLLEDNNLEEICIIGINKPVYVYHKNFSWLETNIVYVSKNILKNLINKLAWFSNKFITLKDPLLNCSLKDNSRLNAIISPISNTPIITIRKFNKNKYTIYDLIKNKTISKKLICFLHLCFLVNSNILIVGNTGSGKTTTLNSLLELVDKNERFVIIEDVKEINIPHKHQVNLLVNKDLNINLYDLVINSLRMRPDRVVIGEVRNKKDCIALIDSLQSGQAKGTYTTFHSQSTKQAISRLLSYGILSSDLDSIDLIINQRRYNTYKKNKLKECRKVFDISEVIYKNNKIEINTLYSFDFAKNKYIKKNNSKKLFSRFKISFNIKDYKELNILLKKTEKSLFNN
jgi:flagellar protein FlaI